MTGTHGAEGTSEGADAPDFVRITQRHLDGFAAISGDHNPIHVDADFAATTDFHLPVAHGMFLAGLVDAAVRRRFPEARMVQQSMMFPAPTPVDTEVSVILSVLSNTPSDRPRDAAETVLRTRVVHADGTEGLSGTCTLRIYDAPVHRHGRTVTR